MPSDVIFFVYIPTANHEYNILSSQCNTKHENQISSKKFDIKIKNASSRRQVLSILSNNDFSENLKLHNIKQPKQYVNTNSELSSNETSNRVFISMEAILDNLLKKLGIEHITWSKDKQDSYYEVIFPVSGGEPCENCIHCLTELGIGLRLNSIVCVIPTQCTYRNLNSNLLQDREPYNIFSDVQENAWKEFINSIRSKLTVKQVVDGVRGSGNLTFDYILLVLTADCLAALGLIENSATNVVAAMLVSPLMGPVMSLTFGTIIADKKLQSIGLKSLFLGVLLSLVFGFIFGLIIGTTDMPWGYNDWPTDEMKGRGNYRSLWMGVLWALPSGIGVAVALLQGSNGPLIGVAISASLLPPIVNCGLFWSLGCIWLIYKPIKMIHIKGESYTEFNSSYKNIYSQYLPIEFFCNGIISACLTFVNIMCIFISAIIVLKIKEVAAPYTSTPELRRFWQHDIRLVRDNNISRDTSLIDSSIYNEISHEKRKQIKKALSDAVSEAINDETFRKIQRLSYGQFKTDQISSIFRTEKDVISNGMEKDMKINNSEYMSVKDELNMLDKLISQLLITQSSDSMYTINNNIQSFSKLNNEYVPLISMNSLQNEENKNEIIINSQTN